LIAPFNELEPVWKAGDPHNGRPALLKNKINEFINANLIQFRKNGNKVVNDPNGIVPNNFFGNPSEEGAYTDGLLGFVHTLKWEGTEEATALYRCDFKDLNKITVDLDGRLRTCENASSRFTSNHLEDFKKDNKQNIIGIDHSTHDLDCHNCLVYLKCRKGCPYALQGQYFYHNCSGYKAFFEPVLMNSFKLIFNSEITYLGLDESAVIKTNDDSFIHMDFVTEAKKGKSETITL